MGPLGAKRECHQMFNEGTHFGRCLTVKIPIKILQWSCLWRISLSRSDSESEPEWLLHIGESKNLNPNGIYSNDGSNKRFELVQSAQSGFNAMTLNHLWELVANTITTFFLLLVIGPFPQSLFIALKRNPWSVNLSWSCSIGRILYHSRSGGLGRVWK